MSTPIVLNKPDGTSKIVYAKNREDAATLCRISKEMSVLLPEMEQLLAIMQSHIAESNENL